jgi:cytochrome b pre-mRNA-processing protein 3
MGWFRTRPEVERARRLYALAMAQARDPGFYRDLGVPDSFDGRFEMIALHVWLLMRRLKDEPDEAPRALGRALAEALVADMDRTFRELGAADLGVGRRVVRTVEAFYGRIAAYDAGLAAPAEAGEAALTEALQRNLFGTAAAAATPPRLAAAARYVRDAAAGLAAQPTAALLDAAVVFPPAPRPPA